MLVIVDTNVPVVANGASGQASPICVLACVQHLNEIISHGRIVLDDGWRILREYMHNLHSVGQPGVGDAFLKWVLTNQANLEKCERVSITPIDPDDPSETDFHEFPSDPDLDHFDPSDRKYIAVACAHRNHPPILQAADHKWWMFRSAFENNGVEVVFLCKDDLQRWIEKES